MYQTLVISKHYSTLSLDKLTHTHIYTYTYTCMDAMQANRCVVPSHHI